MKASEDDGPGGDGEHWDDCGNPRLRAELDRSPSIARERIRGARRWISPACRGDDCEPGSWTRESSGIDKTDIRAILPAIRVPTLVLCPPGERRRRPNARTDLACKIRTPGSSSCPAMTTSRGWATPSRCSRDRGVPHRRATPPEPTASLATVLFTDIVGSTEQRGRDRRRGLAGAASSSITTIAGGARRQRGREVDTAGDGFFATFDGPAAAVRCARRSSRRSARSASRSGPVHTGEVEVDGDDVAESPCNRRPGGCARRARPGTRLFDREGPRCGLRSHVRGRRRARAEGRPRPLAPVPSGGVSGDPRDAVRQNRGRGEHRVQHLGEGAVTSWSTLRTPSATSRCSGSSSRSRSVPPTRGVLAAPIATSPRLDSQEAVVGSLTSRRGLGTSSPSSTHAGRASRALFGSTTGGAALAMFAATYPDRRTRPGLVRPDGAHLLDAGVSVGKWRRSRSAASMMRVTCGARSSGPGGCWS